MNRRSLLKSLSAGIVGLFVAPKIAKGVSRQTERAYALMIKESSYASSQNAK